ncbi:MAG: hypothetical protein A2W01_07515 [Candidatus Solincola sediminis]|uniref:Peptidase S9 prolyl oligopeptidase catalytic domain-containing protein n=1 Tax=Candidatus Solincola sediminis TaxID=1797199 RepID=A0A1F2WU73_9ACTN|nr:MAG: hypothetical protein A2W01_07515 [Candidatus Solincola sediminis]OFW60373.1 MAG: hypothetical protein A2Y75_08430 [Candidatus Solincola sediminis]
MVYRAEKVKAAVIMYQGDADTNVPPSMSWITYHALQKYGQGPVELFIFPGEGHNPICLSHQKRKLFEHVKWFDEYLFND